MQDFLGRSLRRWHLPSLVIAIVTIIGCSPSSLVDVQSPSTVVDPSLVNTATGAAQLRIGALLRMMGALGYSPTTSVIGLSGLLTDELSNTFVLSGATGDDRNIFTLASNKTLSDGYDALQVARVKAQQAEQALHLYAVNVSDVPRAWQGEMYAFEGYTIVWFAELYCSGIPLTAVPLTGAQVPTRGFTTEELYARAIALFDSARVAGADSARFVNLALVGKARALLGLGQFAAADSAARQVPTDFIYQITSAASSTDVFGYFTLPLYVASGYFRVQDHEGGNGLVWSTDPRTAITTESDFSGDMLLPSKYNLTAAGTPEPLTPVYGESLRLADGLEARLIQAEAALAAGDGSWLSILNTLRATCVGTAACAPIPGIAANALPALSDPGTPNARLDTLMKERAMWLYLTGHREGDLRRMARVYGRDPNTLWPTGTMIDPAYPPLYDLPAPEAGKPYGPDVVYGPDPAEHNRNPLYGGCYNTEP